MITRRSSHEKRVAFANFHLGGTGAMAGVPLRNHHTADGKPFPTILTQFDTDPVSQPGFDRSIFIPLDPGKAEAVRKTPHKFGKTALTLVDKYPEFLDPEDISNGSRTIRLLTQLAFEVYRHEIRQQIRETLLQLVAQGGFDVIVPVFGGSSAGGTGSAAVVLLALLFQDPDFRRWMTAGMDPGMLRTPIAFLVEPFAHARLHTGLHVNRLYSNAFATRIETAQLQKQGALKYVFHLGLANSNGAMHSSLPDAAHTLGTAIYTFERQWPDIKSRLVDTVDVHSVRGRINLRRNGTAPSAPSAH